MKGLAEPDPKLRPPERFKAFFVVEPVRPEHNARDNWNTRHLRKRRGARAHRCAFENASFAGANAAFRKNADNASAFEPFQRCPHRRAIHTRSIRGERIHRTEKPVRPTLLEEFQHRHPINMAANCHGKQRRIKVAYVVGRQKERSRTLHALRVQLSDRPKTSEDALCQCAMDSVRKPAHTRKLMTTSSVEKLKVAVIGAGLGGLASAVRLARAGLSVTVFEKNQEIGGKLGFLELDGFRRDTGPSCMLLPQIIRQLWADLGRDAHDDFNFTRLEPSSRWLWEDGTVIDQDDAFWNKPEIEAFLKNTEAIYNGVESLVMQRPIRDISTLLNAPRLLLSRSLHTVLREEVRDPHLVQILSRYAAATGSSPFKTPSAFRVLPYIEAKFGAWYVQGGLSRITQRLGEICNELGVKFRMGEEVNSMGQTSNGYKLAVDGKWEKFHSVICNQDLLKAYQGLLPRKLNGAFRQSYLDRLALSTSAYVLYLGVRRRYSALAHRNWFHSGDDATEMQELFEQHTPASNPTIQVVVSCRSDLSMAPDKSDNLLVIVNAPSLRPGVNWDEIQGAYGDRIIARLEQMGLTDLGKNIAVRREWTPAGFRKMFNQCGGSLHGFASHDFRSSFLRPSMQPKELPGFYFTGAATHPGSGIPQVLISAGNAAKRVLRDCSIK